MLGVSHEAVGFGCGCGECIGEDGGLAIEVLGCVDEGHGLGVAERDCGVVDPSNMRW